MPARVFPQLRKAVSDLNPNQVRSAAERYPAIRVVAAGEAGYRAIETFLTAPRASEERRLEQSLVLHRIGDPAAPTDFDLEIYETGLAKPDQAFAFDPQHPDRLVEEVLARREELGLALARMFPPFRRRVTTQVIATISKENALIAIASALPNIAPGLHLLPWAVTEMTSDTALVTANQIRMLFLLAAASDREIGYRAQRGEIASVIAAAFGWRALARQLAGKIPLGAGLIPKAAIAYAGTWVVGSSAERYYRIGFGYTRQERRELFREAYERGRALARHLAEAIRTGRGRALEGAKP